MSAPRADNIITGGHHGQCQRRRHSLRLATARLGHPLGPGLYPQYPEFVTTWVKFNVHVAVRTELLNTRSLENAAMANRAPRTKLDLLPDLRYLIGCPSYLTCVRSNAEECDG